MKSARGQLEAMKKWTEDVHGDIFSGWTYVCVIALPSTSLASLSSHNNPFIITKETIESGLDKWFEKLLQICNATQSPISDSSAYQSYQEFMKRSVGLSRLDHDLRLTHHQAAVRIQEALHGPGVKPVTAGLNTANRWPQNMQVNENISYSLVILFLTC